MIELSMIKNQLQRFQIMHLFKPWGCQRIEPYELNF
jgi:hypothetical protein